jgi:hypothetical protein
VLSSTGCSNPVLSPLLSCQPGASGTMHPGFRNEFHAGFQQGLGKWAVISGEYIWKYTHNAFDFSVLGNTPITFPIDWHNSKIPGYAANIEIPKYHGFSAYVVTSSVAARFFTPQVAGAGATSGAAEGTVHVPFRIDHDEKFNQTSHIQYEVPGTKWISGLWGGFNYRFDSGLVAGSTPCYNPTDSNTACPNSSFDEFGNPAMLDGQSAVLLVDNNIPYTSNPVNGTNVYLPLTADQEFQALLRRRPRDPKPSDRSAVSGDVLLRVPGFAAYLKPDRYSSTRQRRQRPRPAAHSASRPLRCIGRHEQHLPQRALQGRFGPDRHQCSLGLPYRCHCVCP